MTTEVLAHAFAEGLMIEPLGISEKTRELYEEEIHLLEHKYGQGCFRDGMVRDRIFELKRRLAQG